MAEAADAVAALSAAMAANAVSPPLLLGPGYPVTRQWQRHATFARFQQALRARSGAWSRLRPQSTKPVRVHRKRTAGEAVTHDSDDGNLSRIQVYSVGNPGVLKLYQVDDVRISQVDRRLEANLRKELPTVELADTGLQLDATAIAVDLDVRSSNSRRPGPMKSFAICLTSWIATKRTRRSWLGPANRSTPEVLALLREEHNEYVAQLGFQRLLLYSLAKLGMYLAVSFLCGLYIFHRRRRLLVATASNSRSCCCWCS